MSAHSQLLPHHCQASSIEQRLAFSNLYGSASNIRRTTLYDAYGRSFSYSLCVCLAALTGCELSVYPNLDVLQAGAPRFLGVP